MTTPTPRIVAVVALILSFALIVVPSRMDAQEARESTRKVVNRVVSAYPEMARTMNLKGDVKVEVVVGSSGAVKSVEIKGGPPVLAKSAENAVFKWKWVGGRRKPGVGRDEVQPRIVVLCTPQSISS
jgi:TonB family protein